jgi:dihydroorotate dehydrogenase electron transfer subunit
MATNPVIKQSLFHVVSNRQLTEDVFELRLAGDASAFTHPGQFAEISVSGLFLRRPISVCDWTPDTLLLLVKAVGNGTRAMRELGPGASLDILTGLGNGFDIEQGALAPSVSRSVLVGGGIGIAPLYALARQLIVARQQAGINVALPVVLGFRRVSDTFYVDEFTALGCDVMVATEDGSKGTCGFVTDVLAEHPELAYVYACGPMPMLRAVARLPQVGDGQFSFEARMGCGFGACMGCTIVTASGPKRVCREGPVFRKVEIDWALA